MRLSLCQKTVLIALLICMFATSSSAQADLVSIPLTGVVVSKLLDQFESMAHRLLQTGESVGNGLIARSGGELKLMTENLNILLDDQRNKFFQDLRPETQGLFAEMNKIVESVGDLGVRMSNLEELTALDIQESLNRVRFLTNKRDFFIRSINGYTLNSAVTSHPVTIRGLGIGFDSSDRKYEVHATVADREVPAVNITRTDAYTVVVSIPHDFIKDRFQDREMTHIPFSLSSTISKKGTFKTTVEQYKVTFNLVLLPRVAGQITITEMVESDKTPVGPTLTKTLSKTVASCTPQRPCDWHDSACVNSNQQITNVRYDCNGQCGWCYSLRAREAKATDAKVRPACAAEAARNLPGGGIMQVIRQAWTDKCVADKVRGMEYLPDYDIEQGGACATVYRHCDGENSTTVTHYIEYRDLRSGFTPVTGAPVDLRYGAPFVVDLSRGNKSCAFIAAGKVTLTNQPINLDQNTAAGARPLRIVAAPAIVGDRCRVTFELLK